MAPDVRHVDDVLRRGMRLFGEAIRTEPLMFAVAAAGGVLFSLATVGGAYVLGAVTSRVVEPAYARGEVARAALALAGLALLTVAAVKIVGILGRRLGGGAMQFRLQAHSRRSLARKYLHLPLRWHAGHPTGTLLSRVNSDVESAWYSIAPLPFAVGTLAMIVIAAVALFATDWAMALVGLAVFPAILGVNVVYSRRISPRTRRVQRLRAEVSGVAHESFDGALVVKTLGRERDETSRFAAKADELRDAMVAVGRVRGVFDPLMDAIPNLGTLAVLLVGAWRFGSGAVTLAEVVAVAFLMTILAFPLRAVGWVLGDLPRSVIGADRVREVLTAEGETPYGRSRLDASGPAALALRGVTFSYGTIDRPQGTPVLRDVDLEVAPGRTLALVGPTGSGKSTVVSLVARLLDPDAGILTLDGVDLRELADGEVSGAVALVAQSTFLFDDTVRGNVTLGEELDDARVWRALERAHVAEVVRALPQGLDTELGERGVSLSGGQRQRIALARALVREPRLLVLDDATSSVDPVVEQHILRGLHSGGAPTTVLLVAYRRASIALADEVAYLDGGRVVARGPHERLLADVPGYAELVTAYERAEAGPEVLEVSPPESGVREEAAAR